MKTKFQQNKDDAIRRRASKKTRRKQDQDVKPARVEAAAPALQDLWPGAGLQLDWRDLAPDDFDNKVAPRLLEIDDEDLQLSFLSALWRCAEAACMPILNEMLDRGDKEAANEYARRMGLFANKIVEASNRLEALRKLDHAPHGDVSVKRLTIAQCAWAFHYLLAEVSQTGDGISKIAVARFISALTGREFDKVYARVKNKYGERSEETARADLRVVRGHFAAMGLTEIVEKISRELVG